MVKSKRNSDSFKFMPKRKVTVTVEQRFLEWADKEVLTLRFRNRSHVFEYAVAQLMKQDKKE